MPEAHVLLGNFLFNLICEVHGSHSFVSLLLFLIKVSSLLRIWLKSIHLQLVNEVAGIRGLMPEENLSQGKAEFAVSIGAVPIDYVII